MEQQITEIMENTENAEQVLDAQIQAEIDTTVAELMEKDPKLKTVFPFVIDGADYDDKPYYTAYFRQPTLQAFSKYLTASQKGNTAIAMRQLATDCFLAGDKELVDDESLFLFGLMGQFGRIIEMRHGRLANLSKPRK